MEKTQFGREKFFQDTMNFRDLGGYKAFDGRSVKHHMFYRSGMLISLASEAEKAKFLELKIQMILDFRSGKEAEAAPDPTFPGTDYVHICALYKENGKEMEFAPIDIEKLLMNPENVSGHVDGMVQKMYGRMAFDNPGFQKLFQEIEKNHVPILFHCTAGKDRTGVAAMLILLALGVDEETALEDYLLTNLYRKDAIEASLREHADQIAKVPEFRTFYSLADGVDRKAAELTLNAIKEKYGTYDAYFEAEYGLTREKLEKLRDTYLE